MYCKELDINWYPELNELLDNCDCMLISVRKDKVNKYIDYIKNCDYYLAYKSKNLYGKDGNCYKNIYERTSEPIIMDTEAKWILLTNNCKYRYVIKKEHNKNYHKEINEELQQKLKKYVFLSVEREDDWIQIIWYVKCVKEIQLPRNEYKSLPYRQTMSRVSPGNEDYERLNTLLNSNY